MFLFGLVGFLTLYLLNRAFGTGNKEPSAEENPKEGSDDKNLVIFVDHDGCTDEKLFVFHRFTSPPIYIWIHLSHKVAVYVDHLLIQLLPFFHGKSTTSTICTVV